MTLRLVPSHTIDRSSPEAERAAIEAVHRLHYGRRDRAPTYVAALILSAIVLAAVVLW